VSRVFQIMKELPQNLKAVLQDVGEQKALLMLSLLLIKEGLADWSVFRNYLDDGCDLLLLSSSRKIKLEVKTRQSILVSKHSGVRVQFTVTKKERECADFILAYWLDRDAFFVVPASELKATSSNGKPLFKFIAHHSSFDHEFTSSSRPYYEDWERILEVLR
jgi:hypothetical protein